MTLDETIDYTTAKKLQPPGIQKQNPTASRKTAVDEETDGELRSPEVWERDVVKSRRAETDGLLRPPEVWETSVVKLRPVEVGNRLRLADGDKNLRPGELGIQPAEAGAKMQEGDYAKKLRQAGADKKAQQGVSVNA